MRGLMVAVVVMGVLIVGGTITLGVLIVHRIGSGTPADAPPLLLEEPVGTRIAGIAGLGDRLAVQLQGGGPDRVLLLDARNLRPVGRAALAH